MVFVYGVCRIISSWFFAVYCALNNLQLQINRGLLHTQNIADHGLCWTKVKPIAHLYAVSQAFYRAAATGTTKLHSRGQNFTVCIHGLYTFPYWIQICWCPVSVNCRNLQQYNFQTHPVLPCDKMKKYDPYSSLIVALVAVLIFVSPRVQNLLVMANPR